MKITIRIFAFVLAFFILAIAFKPQTNVGMDNHLSKISALGLVSDFNFISDKDVLEEESELDKNLTFLIVFSSILSLLCAKTYSVILPNRLDGIKASPSHIPVYLRSGKLTL